MDGPSQGLSNVISEGLSIDIFQADEALGLDRFIGAHADEINAARFGSLFGSLQGMLVSSAILSITRLFEPVNRRYPMHSIPVALQILEREARTLPILQKHVLMEKMVEEGHEAATRSVTDFDLTMLIVHVFSSTLPKPGKSDELSIALNALKASRDKSIAHREAIKVESLPRTTYSKMEGLLRYAKKFVSTVGRAYCNTIYEWTDGTYVLTSDAERTMRSLNRLLKDAGVIKRN